jgi:predicted N-formylglutamate amidohydrolase
MTEEACEIINATAPGRWVVTCDHASNAVPDWLGATLGLPEADMARHIAWDPGAAGVTRALANRLESPAILSTFSRLVIDPNRGADDPTLIMQLYDGTVIPGNRTPDRVARMDRLYRPYHAGLAALMNRPAPVLCAIHSFTPCLRGRAPRPWAVGILHSHRDTRLALPLIAALRADGVVVGDNEPYNGHLPGDSVDRHALDRGHPNVLIELRQDLIATPDQQVEWADRLAPVLVRVLADSGL